MQQNQLVALLCSLGVITIALSILFRSSINVSTILLIIGCGLVGFGFVKLLANHKKDLK